MSKKIINNILEKASEIYFKQDFNTLFEYLISKQLLFSIDTKQENKRFNHLLALAYVFQENILEAERHCNDCLLVEPNELDYYFVLGYVHLKLREYDKCLKTSQLYLELYNCKKTADLSYTFTGHHKCQIFSFLGSAETELGNTEKAVTHFFKAIETEKENQLPYLQLVNLYIHINEYKQAKKIIQKGIKVCSQIQELRLLEKSLEIKQQDSGMNQIKLDEILSENSILTPDSKEFASLTIIGDTFKNEEKYDKAIQIYEILLAVEPTNEHLLYTLSECYLLMGHKDSAIIGFQRILKLNPKNKRAQEQLDCFNKFILSN